MNSVYLVFLLDIRGSGFLARVGVVQVSLSFVIGEVRERLLG